MTTPFTYAQQELLAEAIAEAIIRCERIAENHSETAPAFNNSRFGLQILEEVLAELVPDAHVLSRDIISKIRIDRAFEAKRPGTFGVNIDA